VTKMVAGSIPQQGVRLGKAVGAKCMSARTLVRRGSFLRETAGTCLWYAGCFDVRNWHTSVISAHEAANTVVVSLAQRAIGA